MYAVIKTGGKQYKVAKDQIVTVERLAGEPGDILAIEEVLMVGDGAASQVGTPLVAGATVAAEVVEQSRGPKIIVFKKKRRKNHRRRNGHRQHETVLRVTEILTDGKKPSKAKAKPAPAAAAPAPEAETAEKAPKEAAAKKAAKTAPAKKAPAKKAAPKKAAPKKAAAKKTAAKKGAKKSAKKEE